MATSTDRPGTGAGGPRAPAHALDADALARAVNDAARAAGTQQAAARAAAREEREAYLRHGTPEARRRRAARTLMLVAVPVALLATALNVVGLGPERVVAPAGPSIAAPADGAKADLRFVAAAVHAYASRRHALPRSLADLGPDLPSRVRYEPRANGTFRLVAGHRAAAAAYDSATDPRPGRAR